MKKLLAAAALFSSFIFISCGDNSTKETTTDATTTDKKEVAEDQNEKKFDTTNKERDAEFAVDVADGGMLEVQLGKLAQKNASSKRVKDFAQMMVDDHSKSNAELMETAKQKNITLPTGLSDKCQKKYNDISVKKGKDFDKEYMSAMVDGHEKNIDKFKKEADDGNDAQLKAWAGSKLPTLQHHLEVAKNIKDSL